MVLDRIDALEADMRKLKANPAVAKVIADGEAQLAAEAKKAKDAADKAAAEQQKAEKADEAQQQPQSQRSKQSAA